VKHASRLLGVDYGHVRIGLAITDEDRRIASPLATYHRRTRDEDARFFQEVVTAETVEKIVVGLPVHVDGSEGNKAAEARRFGAWLAGATGLPIVYFDERFTTVEAESHLLAAGLTSKRRKARRDRVAAQILLQSYIDAGCPLDPKATPLN
jgi:putative Holliday junction resolvase